MMARPRAGPAVFVVTPASPWFVRADVPLRRRSSAKKTWWLAKFPVGARSGAWPVFLPETEPLLSPTEMTSEPPSATRRVLRPLRPAADRALTPLPSFWQADPPTAPCASRRPTQTRSPLLRWRAIGPPSTVGVALGPAPTSSTGIPGRCRSTPFTAPLRPARRAFLAGDADDLPTTATGGRGCSLRSSCGDRAP